MAFGACNIANSITDCAFSYVRPKKKAAEDLRLEWGWLQCLSSAFQRL